MMVLPSSRANEWRICINATADVLSNPLVGSSSKMMVGSVNNSLPILTRFFSPPEIMNIGVSAHFWSRNCLIIRSTSATFRLLSQVDGSRKKAVYVN
mmetsp:Transcript_25402/g.45873  ORF Transcript_25402/g.45873 Transcript_25402/m.45873 type:complete len:97 (+) Transcript_25402:1592-1882(+)